MYSLNEEIRRMYTDTVGGLDQEKSMDENGEVLELYIGMVISGQTSMLESSQVAYVIQGMIDAGQVTMIDSFAEQILKRVVNEQAEIPTSKLFQVREDATALFQGLAKSHEFTNAITAIAIRRGIKEQIVSFDTESKEFSQHD